jgi:RND superfamily putative drug exporter
VPRALASAGRAVALSGATVIVALAGMFLVDIQAVRSMAVGAMLAVALVVLAALTLLPAVLALLGGRVDRLHLPRLGRTRPGAGGFWHHWAVTIMRRPWTFLLASLVILAVLTAPVASIRLGQSGAASLPGGEEPRVALERLTAAFGAGVVGPIEIVVDTPGGATAPANLERIGRLTELLRADPAVAQVASLATLPPAALAAGVDRMDPRLRVAAAGLANWERGADLARVRVISRDRPESRAAEDLVERVRERYLPAAGLAGRARVGGATALDVDMTAELSRRLPLVVVAVLALSFLLLASAFRSLLLPLKAVAMNLLSVGATLGLLVAVFQWGWGQHLLGFTSEGHLDQLTPLFLFCILFGLSMDYEVFLLSRVREEYQRTGSNELGVARGLEATARTITAAALIMVTVFGAFGAGRLVTLKQVGLGLAAAVFIDASVVRVVLVPAAMKLMGHWNWWLPAWLDRWLPRVEPEPSEPGAGGHRPAPDALVGAHPAAPLGREP